MYPFCLATLVQVLEKFYPKTVVHDFKELAEKVKVAVELTKKSVDILVVNFDNERLSSLLVLSLDDQVTINTVRNL